MKSKVMFITLFGIFLTLICFCTKVDAASASISATKTTATVGDSVSVNVSINAATWNVKVSGNGITGDSIVGYDEDGNNKSTSKAFKLNTSKAGTYTVKISGDVTDGATEVNSTVNKSVTVTVKEKAQKPTTNTSSNSSNTTQTPNTPSTPTQPTQNTPQQPSQPTTQTKPQASSNANLSNLGIKTYDFKGFKAGTTSYNTTVPNDVTQVTVYATTQDSGAKYSVSGNTNLDVGTNKVTITVTAADKKTTKNYYIYVARKAGESTEEVVPNVIDENSGEGEREGETETPTPAEQEKLSVLSIAIEDGHEVYLEPEFNPEVYEYVINLKEDLDSIPLKIITNKQNAIQKIEGNENLKEGDNEILITVTSQDGQEELKYKIKVVKNMEVIEEHKKIETVEPENLYKSEETEAKHNNLWIIVGVIVGVILIVAIILFAVNFKTLKTGRH